ncbi:hypothetical protein V6N12_051341 [Hibiscus sabdariffa]|uniref:Non-structural maintenance of chromosomes element 1 homolog n=1 Tax=Hibiscus sabdariffa TaxID=183260 RepID=A0ABR2GFW7_9ROSI
MAVLSWKHHTLIQTLLERGPLLEKDFHSIFTAITGQNPGTHQGKFNDYLLKINRELSYLQLDLRACRDPYDGRVYYGVVNNVSDEQSKLGTKYSVPQIAFFKAIVEAIAQDVTAVGCICNMDALNIKLENQVLNNSGSQSQDGSLGIPAAFRNFTMSQKEKTIDQLVIDKWLCYTEDDNIGVGVSACLIFLVDAASLFSSFWPCWPDRAQMKGVIVCPSCDTQWQYQPPKAEPLELEDEETEVMQSQPSSQPLQSQVQSSLRSRRKRERVGRNDDADTVGCDTRRVTRQSAHLR